MTTGRRNTAVRGRDGGLQVRRYTEADRDAVLALWRRAGIDRPWLDLASEIDEKRKRDRSLFLVAVHANGSPAQ